jgi:hypothetical protein
MPVVGAFRAMALFSVFAASLLKGDFFPDFFEADKWMGVSEFLNAASPKTGSEIAKLLIWSFIAGFSERFVPGVLDHLWVELNRRRKSFIEMIGCLKSGRRNWIAERLMTETVF